jgi:uncharacterized protein (TIGR00290 family)
MASWFLPRPFTSNVDIAVKAVADIALMVSKKKITISWSGGKDSAFALYKILLCGEYEVVHLHTVFNSDTKRVGMHGVHESLIEKQAEAIGLPLTKLYLPESNDHDKYKALMEKFYKNCFLEGISGVVFGDIFLEDLRDFRIGLLKPSHLDGIFPIWKIDSSKLMDDFLNVGFKTILCSAKTEYFDSDHLGKTITEDFVTEFSDKIDVCGENGEFHSFVYDGPLFKTPVPVVLGDVISKSYSYKVTLEDGTVNEQQTLFWFQDLSVVNN